MKRRAWIVLIFAATLSLLIASLAESAQIAKPSTETSVAAKQSPGKPGGRTSKPAKVDPDQAYKANCLRCHWEPRKLSELEMVTVMRHMRVRANLTVEEARAIFGIPNAIVPQFVFLRRSEF